MLTLVRSLPANVLVDAVSIRAFDAPVGCPFAIDAMFIAELGC